MVKNHSDSERGNPLPPLWKKDKGEKRRRKERKEGNVLFNDALNTFYFTVIWLRIHGKEPLR